MNKHLYYSKTFEEVSFLDAQLFFSFKQKIFKYNLDPGQNIYHQSNYQLFTILAQIMKIKIIEKQKSLFF